MTRITDRAHLLPYHNQCAGCDERASYYFITFAYNGSFRISTPYVSSRMTLVRTPIFANIAVRAAKKAAGAGVRL